MKTGPQKQVPKSNWHILAYVVLKFGPNTNSVLHGTRNRSLTE